MKHLALLIIAALAALPATAQDVVISNLEYSRATRANTTVGGLGFVTEYKAIYLQFQAEELTEVVSEATLWVYVNSVFDPDAAGSVSIDATYGAADLEWDDGDSAATLSGLSMGDAETGGTIPTAAGSWFAIDVTAALLNAYAGGTPTTITIKLMRTAGTEDSAQSGLQIGHHEADAILSPTDQTGPYVVIATGANSPYIDVHYEVTPGEGEGEGEGETYVDDGLLEFF